MRACTQTRVHPHITPQPATHTHTHRAHTHTTPQPATHTTPIPAPSGNSQKWPLVTQPLALHISLLTGKHSLLLPACSLDLTLLYSLPTLCQEPSRSHHSPTHSSLHIPPPPYTRRHTRTPHTSLTLGKLHPSLALMPQKIQDLSKRHHNLNLTCNSSQFSNGVINAANLNFLHNEVASWFATKEIILQGRWRQRLFQAAGNTTEPADGAQLITC